MGCGEQQLLPRVREASPEVLVVADGFFCKTQIAHGAGRRATRRRVEATTSAGTSDRRWS